MGGYIEKIVNNRGKILQETKILTEDKVKCRKGITNDSGNQTPGRAKGKEEEENEV